VPFADEPFARAVDVVAHRPTWADEGAALIVVLRGLIPDADAVDHIGSTAVPGLPAKDCLDAMVRVGSLVDIDLGALANAGYRERPETWNRAEVLGAASYPKKVFAPPVGGRPVNIHVRQTASPTARYALLFRDFLRGDMDSREAWGEFKTRLAEANLDIYAYGQIKATAQPLLMRLAEQWAADTCWST
jgi:dephospho-CoA kinase